MLDIFKLSESGEAKTVVAPTAQAKVNSVLPYPLRRQKIEITVKHEFPKHLFRPEDAIDVHEVKCRSLGTSLADLWSWETGDNEFMVINYLTTLPSGGNGAINFDWKIFIDGICESDSLSTDKRNMFLARWGAILEYEYALLGNFVTALPNPQNVYMLMKPHSKLTIQGACSAASHYGYVTLMGYRFIDVELANKLSK